MRVDILVRELCKFVIAVLDSPEVCIALEELPQLLLEGFAGKAIGLKTGLVGIKGGVETAKVCNILGLG